MDFDADIVIFIGFNKTGSTYLRNYLSKSIKDKDIIYSDNFYLFTEYIIYSLDEEFEIDFAKKLFTDGLSSISKEKVDLIFLEQLTFNYYKIFDQKKVVFRLCKIFKKLKIILGYRNHIDLLKSTWIQYLKNGGNLYLNNYINLLLSKRRSELCMMHFGYLIKNIIEILGKEKLFFYDINELNDSKTFLNKISKFINSNKFEHSEISKKKSNISFSPYKIHILIFFNTFIKFDLGLNDYNLNIKEKSTNFYLNIKKRIRYKYKHLFINTLLHHLPDGKDNYFVINKNNQEKIQKYFIKSNVIIENLNKN